MVFIKIVFPLLVLFSYTWEESIDPKIDPMPSIRLEYYKGKKLTGGRFNITVTITHKGIPKRKPIDSCLPEEWDSKSERLIIPTGKAKASVIQRNQKIRQRMAEYILRYDELVESGEYWNAGDVFSGDTVTATEVKPTTFWDLAELYLKYLREEKSGATCLWFNGVIKKFKTHIDNPDFKLSDFTDKVIDKYRVFMIKEGNSSSTMNANFKILRFVSNYAAKKGLASKPDALHDFKLPKRTYGAKRKLDDTEIDLFRNVDVLKDSKIQEIKDMFLLAYLFRGMRISDVIRMKRSFIQGNKLIYTSSKNEKLFEMKIPAEGIKILNKYPKDREYVFSFYTFKPNPLLSDGQNRINEYMVIKAISANINNKLKVLGKRAGITKSISTHIARHSFAKKALEVFKGDTNLTMDLLGHNSLSVHQAYVRELSKSDDLDNAVDQMFGEI